MENLKLLWDKIKSLPFWLRAIVMYLAVTIMLIFTVVSCGSTTKATIRHAAEGATTSVTISTNNPTNWDVSPDVQLPSIN